MKLWLAAIAAGLGIGSGTFAQLNPDNSWRFGPYDKVIAPKPPSIVFTSPPPPALRGAIVREKTSTNAPVAPVRKEK